MFPDTHFWIGTGFEPDVHGEAIPDETGSHDYLGRYTNRTIILTLPADRDVHTIDYLSLWSRGLERSLAHVNIPRDMIRQI
jgi:hypothetical protein